MSCHAELVSASTAYLVLRSRNKFGMTPDGKLVSAPQMRSFASQNYVRRPYKLTVPNQRNLNKCVVLLRKTTGESSKNTTQSTSKGFRRPFYRHLPQLRRRPAVQLKLYILFMCIYCLYT